MNEHHEYFDHVERLQREFDEKWEQDPAMRAEWWRLQAVLLGEEDSA